MYSPSHYCIVLLAVLAVGHGCAAQIDLRVTVQDRSTAEPIEDALVLARYYAPKLHPQPPGAGGRTDHNGEVLLPLINRDLPLSIEVDAPGHSRLQFSVSVQELIASQKLGEAGERLFPSGTLDVRVQTISTSP